MASRVLRLVRNIVIAAVVSTAATGLISLFWKMIGGGDLPVHGWIALLLGVSGTVVLAWVLMGLAFKSSREGWDDQVDNTLDPGRDDPCRDETDS